jgi:hypothetical protein
MPGIALGRAAVERGVRHFRAQVGQGTAPVRRLPDENGAIVRTTLDGGTMFDVDSAAYRTLSNHADSLKKDVIT